MSICRLRFLILYSSTFRTGERYATGLQGDGILHILWERIPLTRMRMSCPSGSEEHLDGHNHENGYHSYQTRHGRVPFVPEPWKTWIRHRNKRRRKEVDKRRRKKHSGTKMPRKEEKSMRYGKAGEAAGDDREGACYISSAYRKHLPHEKIRT